MKRSAQRIANITASVAQEKVGSGLRLHCWDHRLTITDVRSADPSVAYPRYVAGEQAAPPEDCGGVPGFYASLEALADPNHPDHEEVTDWFEGYDPNVFDELALKRAVGRTASPKRAAKKA